MCFWRTEFPKEARFAWHRCEGQDMPADTTMSADFLKASEVRKMSILSDTSTWVIARGYLRPSWRCKSDDSSICLKSERYYACYHNQVTAQLDNMFNAFSRSRKSFVQNEIHRYKNTFLLTFLTLPQAREVWCMFAIHSKHLLNSQVYREQNTHAIPYLQA